MALAQMAPPLLEAETLFNRTLQGVRKVSLGDGGQGILRGAALKKPRCLKVWMIYTWWE